MDARGNSGAGRAVVLVGTRRGSFIFTADATRARWEQRGAHAGDGVFSLRHDPRTGALLAAVNNAAGPCLETSPDLGATWRALGGGFGAATEVWQIQPGPAERPGELWAGLRDAALYRSADGGASWQPVPGLNQHPTSATWMSGGGGLILHTIVPDPHDANRVYAGVSAGGVYRSDDAGQTWRPANGGVRADFLAEEGAPEGSCRPETGQCVHKFVAHPTRPSVLYQQNHCGVYRSDDAGESWVEIYAGLPSSFGFPIVVHPHKPATVYVVPLKGDRDRNPPGGQLAVWRSDDGGHSWQAKSAGLPNTGRLAVLRECLATDAAPRAGLYVGVADGRVYQSLDDGESWSLLADGLPPVLSVDAAYLPA